MAWNDADQRKLERELKATRRMLESQKREASASAGQATQQRWDGVDEMVGRYLALAAGAVVACAGLVLGVGHLTARVFDGAWPSYAVDDAPGVLTRLLADPGDPAAAWEPVNGGGQPPGALAWWLTLIMAVLVVAALVALLLRLVSRREQDYVPLAADTDEAAGAEASLGGPAAPVGWRSARDLEAQGFKGGGVVVGTSGRRQLALDPLHSLMVVGPAHSGKTSGVAIPALLEWEGPAVAASTKDHLMDETIGWRSHLGEVLVYDPAGVNRYGQAGWSPLYDCSTWQGAIRMAQHLTAAAKASVGGRIDGGEPGRIDEGALWSSAMSMSLAPFLYAAAVSGRSVVETAEWIEREEQDEVIAVLGPIDEHAAHVHQTTFSRQDPSRSAYFHVMFQVLSVYSDPTVAATADRHEVVAGDLLNGGKDTIYLTAPEHDQSRFQPLFATIVRQIVTAVNERFASTGRPLHPPLLLVLDDAVGVASLEALAELASTGVTKGVQVVSTFEDLGRLADLPDQVRNLIVRNHRAKVVLPGDHGPGTAGLLLPGLVDEVAKGGGALVYGSDRPVRMQVRRWYDDEELKQRVATEKSQLRPGESRVRHGSRSPIDAEPDYQLVVEEAGFFGRRRRRPGSHRPVREPAPSTPEVDVGGRLVPSVEDILGRTGGSAADEEDDLTA